MYVPADAITPRRAFIPNQFSYDVPKGCLHYVIWYAGVGAEPPSDEQVRTSLPPSLTHTHTHTPLRAAAGDTWLMGGRVRCAGPDHGGRGRGYPA
eukprot:COSAG06_NODE_18491_length_885_cov_0.941476_2_plen_95_part_00